MVCNAAKVSEVLVYLPHYGIFIRFNEGTGDNLLPEDKTAGYVDYINWTSFRVSSPAYDEAFFDEEDDGMALLKEYYSSLSMQEILNAVFSQCDIPAGTLVVPIDFEL